MPLSRSPLLLGALILVLHPAISSAGYIAVTHNSNETKAVSVYYSGWGTSHNVRAGNMRGRYYDDKPTDLPKSPGYFTDNYFDMYCVNLMEFISPPTYYEAVVRTTSSTNPKLPNGELIAGLLEKYLDTVSTADQRAALQLAIWEARYDGYHSTKTDSFRSGSFKVNNSNSLVDLAWGYLKAAKEEITPLSNHVGTWYDPTGKGQDMVTTQAVPVPPTLALAGSGIFCFLLGRRRNSKKPTPATAMA